jgi:hypothetical protein
MSFAATVFTSVPRRNPAIAFADSTPLASASSPGRAAPQSAQPPQRHRRRILFGFRFTCHAGRMARTGARLKAEKTLFDVFACRQMRLPASLRHAPPCMKRKSRKRAARWTLGLKKLKAISIRQPWAWLIVNGYKDVENRIWAANVRGRVLIHAGASKSDTNPEALVYDPSRKRCQWS